MDFELNRALVDSIKILLVSIGIFFVFGPLSILTRNIEQNRSPDNQQPVNGEVVEGKYRIVEDDGDTPVHRNDTE